MQSMDYHLTISMMVESLFPEHKLYVIHLAEFYPYIIFHISKQPLLPNIFFS